MSSLIYCIFIQYLRYVKKIYPPMSEARDIEISFICLRLFFSHASISNKNPSRSTNSFAIEMRGMFDQIFVMN